MLSTLLHIWRILRPFHGGFAVAVVLASVTSALLLASPFVMKYLIDGLTEGIDVRSAMLLAGLAIAAQFANSAVQAVLEKHSALVLIRAELFVRERAFAKLLDLTLSFHERESTGRKTARVMRGAAAVDRMVSLIIWNVLPTVVHLSLTAAVLVAEAPVFAMVFLLGIPLFFLVSVRMDKYLEPLRVEINDNFERANDVATQSLLHVQTVQSFAVERRTLEEFRGIQGIIQRAVHRQRWILFGWDATRMMVQDISFAAIAIMGVLWVLGGDMSIGSFVFVASVAMQAMGRLFSVTHVSNQLRDAREPAERVLALDRETPTVADRPGAVVPTSVEGRLTLRDVSFTYGTATTPALQGVSFDIQPGQQAAFVGPSGAGKSTVIKLLFRHYDPSAGAVLLDGTDLREFNRTAFRSHFGLVSQDVEVFSGTVRENIAYAELDAPMDRVEAAARAANADGFIRALPEGYDTQIGERGIKLSGGQRQRIGIARALLRDPAVLVFDEATSHLDSESERLIQHALEEIRGRRTLIVIAHRLSTVRNSDQLFVLEDGRIVESGTHTTLLERGGLYRKLAELQSIGAVLDG